MKVFWVEKARRARRQLVDYIAGDDIAAALEVDEAISSAVLRLEQFPLLGKPGRINGTRELVIHKHYIIVYELFEDSVVILMLLHSSRTWPPDYVD